MTKTVIILNAPPNSGKDTLADLMVKELNATKQEFKETLYEETAKHYNMDLEIFKKTATDREFKDNKRSIFAQTFDITPREALIHVSETVIKPLYGNSYFGERAAQRLTDGLNVFSDGGGWWEELAPVAIAADRLIICRLYRHGFTFGNDSRDYYDTDKLPTDFGFWVSICDIHLEHGKPHAAIDSIKNLLNSRK